MADLIRSIEEKDFQQVSKLYNFRKSIDELKWIFQDPENSKKYNAFVAVNNSDEIIGAIGYTTSTYSQGELSFTGVIFMSWIVDSQYKGFAGILLLKKVAQMGDFAFTVSGSKLGRSFYPMLKYNFFSHSEIYNKILQISNIYPSIKRKTFVKSIGLLGYLLPSYFKTPKKKYLKKGIELIPYTGINYFEEPSYENAFKKNISKNYIDWLLDCPLIHPYGFCIKLNETYYGVCVLYIQKINGIKKGRIVHLPFLGNDENLWIEVIENCSEFFKKENCSIVSGMAHHEICRKVFKKSGYISIQNHSKPNYIKNNSADSMVKIKFEHWHLQYSEGDKAYRGI